MLGKIKITKKDLRSTARLVACGYDEAQFLLKFESPIAYVASRVYGWRCDVYSLPHGITLATGYNTVGKDLDYDFVREYDNKARDVLRNRESKSEREEVNKMLDEFCKKIEDEQMWKK